MNILIWKLARIIHGYLTNDRGATMVEYALLVTFIGAGIIGVLSAFGTDAWGHLTHKISTTIK